jgi:hypothetical protein
MSIVVSAQAHRRSRIRNLQVSSDIGVKSVTKQERESFRYIKDILGVRPHKFSDFMANNWLFESLRKEDRNRGIYVPNSAENHNPSGLVIWVR